MLEVNQLQNIQEGIPATSDISKPTSATSPTTATRSQRKRTRTRGNASVKHIVGGSAARENVVQAAARHLKDNQSQSQCSTATSPPPPAKPTENDVLDAWLRNPDYDNPPPQMLEMARRVRVAMDAKQAERDAAAEAAAEASTPAAPNAHARGETKLHTYRLPTVLPKPIQLKQVSNEQIAKLDPELNGVALELVHDALVKRRLPMVKGLHSIYKDPEYLKVHEGNKFADVRINRSHPDSTVIYPTHLLAVGASSGEGAWSVWPTNALSLVSHCSRIAEFPPPGPTAPEPDAESICLPLVHLRIPKPKAFAPLFEFCYSRDYNQLCVQLSGLPLDLIADMAKDAPTREKITNFNLLVDAVKAHYVNGHGLLERMQYVHGVWGNAVELGIFDDAVWRGLQAVWNVLSVALAKSDGVVTAPSGPPRSPPVPIILPPAPPARL